MSEKKLKKENLTQKLIAILTGAVAGLINGLFGGGGGMIVVPMLIFLLKRETKKAHATAILIILPLSILSGILYIWYGNLKIETGLPVALGVVAGGIIGALTLKKLSSKWIVLIFSLVMIFAGAKMLFF